MKINRHYKKICPHHLWWDAVKHIEKTFPQRACTTTSRCCTRLCPFGPRKKYAEDEFECTYPIPHEIAMKAMKLRKLIEERNR